MNGLDFLEGLPTPERVGLGQAAGLDSGQTTQLVQESTYFHPGNPMPSAVIEEKVWPAFMSQTSAIIAKLLLYPAICMSNEKTPSVIWNNI